MPDPPSGPRRYVPVPGVVDLDAVEPDAVEPNPAARPEPELVPAYPSPFREPAPASPLVAPEPEIDPSVTPTAPAPGPTAPGPPTPDGSAPPPTSRTASGYPDDPSAPPPTPDAPGEAPSERPGSTPAETPGEAPVSAPHPEPPQAPGGAPAEPHGRAPSGYPDAPDAPPPPLRPPAEIVESAKEATRSRGRELVALVVQYGRRHLPHTPARAPSVDDGPPRLVGRIGQAIPYLRVIPWLLAAVFAVSFWWDFPGAEVVLFGQALPLDGLLRVLSVSGLIGFGTNWLAITMLFQPREKRAIVPQGLIPAQRERVIYRLSDAISRELINADIIKQKIQESGVIGRYRDLALGVVRGVVEDPDFRADLKGLAQRYAQETLGSEAVRRELAGLAVQKVEEQAGQGLGGIALRLYRTFAETDFQRRVDRALAELPQAVTPLLDRIDTALDAVPAKVEARGDEIEEAATKAVLSFVEGFDVRAMIMEKARGFDEAQLEGLLKSTSNEQLNYIKYLGGILGVFGGLVIWQPLGALVVFTAVGLALWGLDEALVRARRPRP